jgi:DNA-binding CsgD family transcriptional regulator
MRLGESDEYLEQALADGRVTQEPQYLFPCFMGLAESAWLAGDAAHAREQLKNAVAAVASSIGSWRAGEVAVWSRRLGLALERPWPENLALPREAELKGDAAGGARLWDEIGAPYQAALCLAHSDQSEHLAEALLRLEKLEARAAINWVRRRASTLGIGNALPKLRRGPYRAARSHPYGLTEKECRILGLLSKGQGNEEISKSLNRSRRTVEHHVASVLAKLNAKNRVEVILRTQSEPWLLQSTS